MVAAMNIQDFDARTRIHRKQVRLQIYMIL